MELDFYDELDKQEQENENNEYWEQQYDELQIKYDCLMEAFKIQKDILTSKNKIINKAIKEIEYFELKANHLDDEIYLDEELSNKLLKILRGEDNEE